MPTDTEIPPSKAPAALMQTARACERFLGRMVRIEDDGFRSVPAADGEAPGIRMMTGTLDGATIVVRSELARIPDGNGINAALLLRRMRRLGDKARVVPAPERDARDGAPLVVELRVAAKALSYGREAALLAQLELMDTVARELAARIPAPSAADEARVAAYKPLAQVIEPVLPAEALGLAAGRSPELCAWIDDTLDYLQAGAPVAVVAVTTVEADYAASALAGVLEARGGSLGRLKAPVANGATLLEMLDKAPGAVWIPAALVTIASNPYEEQAASALLDVLDRGVQPAIFAGTDAALRVLFGGGQGAARDPLRPVLRTLPVRFAELRQLVAFAVAVAATRAGATPGAVEDAVLDVSSALEHCPAGAQRALLPMTATRAVRLRLAGRAGETADSTVFVQRAAGLSETFAALSPGHGHGRDACTQARLVRRLTDAGLQGQLLCKLLGQQSALRELATRLAAEALTRPAHQPIRYCVQGTPGTGKSQSTELIANWLGVPYVVLDAASFADTHTAAAQLLGSGRGIVGSYQRGRLETIANQPEGAVLEVADLDHAPPSVRASLGEMFLQMLETGLAQSAKGHTFSVASVVFVFTVNLPGGADERLRRGMGFVHANTRGDLRREVHDELTALISSAFASRVGVPLLFDPLDASCIAAIAARAVHDGLRIALARLGLPTVNVTLDPQVGPRLVAAHRQQNGYGARGIADLGRSAAAAAVLAWLAGGEPPPCSALHAHATTDARLVVETVGAHEAVHTEQARTATGTRPVPAAD